MVTTRKANESELLYLQAQLAMQPKLEQVNLREGIVYVAEHDGDVIQFINARLVWQIEPLLRIEKKGVPKNAYRRGALLLYRCVGNFIRDSNIPIRSYFAHITQRSTWSWVEKLKFHRIYPGGRLYAKDVDNQQQP